MKIGDAVRLRDRRSKFSIRLRGDVGEWSRAHMSGSDVAFVLELAQLDPSSGGVQPGSHDVRVLTPTGIGWIVEELIEEAT